MSMDDALDFDFEEPTIISPAIAKKKWALLFYFPLFLVILFSFFFLAFPIVLILYVFDCYALVSVSIEEKLLA